MVKILKVVHSALTMAFSTKKRASVTPVKGLNMLKGVKQNVPHLSCLLLLKNGKTGRGVTVYIRSNAIHVHVAPYLPVHVKYVRIMSQSVTDCLKWHLTI